MIRRLAGLGALAALPVAFLAVFFVLPVGGMVSRGFFEGGAFDPAGVLEVLTRPRVVRVAWFTLWSSSVATLLAVLLGLPAAFALHRLRLPGRQVVRAVLLVPFVLPSVVVGVAFRQLLGPNGALGWAGLDQTPVAVIAGLVFFNVSVVIRVVGAAWEQLDERPAQAAAALGATPWQVLRTVTLPALRPAIVSAASVVFLFCATAFGIVLTLGGLRHATVESEIYLLTTTVFDLRAAATLSVVQFAVVVALLALAARARRGEDAVVARAPAAPLRVRAIHAPVLAVTTLLLVAVAAPIASLVAGSLRTEDGWGLANYRALSGRGEGEVLLVPVTDALASSLRIAVDATWIALLLGLCVALIVTRRSRSAPERRLRTLLDGFFMLPLGVSAVTLGFGFLVTLDSGVLDLRGSPLLVPIAQALVALPLVVRTLTPVLSGIDDRQRQAAASLGASPWRALWVVDVPVLFRPLLAASGFAFAASLGEFGATAFLARDAAPTLPVVIFRLIGTPGEHNYAMALAASVVLAGVTAAVMFAVERLRVPGARFL